MVRIGDRLLGKAPTLVLAVTRAEGVLRQAQRIGIHVVELRVDGIAAVTPIRAVSTAESLRRYNLPLLATVRSKHEGGMVDLADDKRAALYQALLPMVDAVDIEIASVGALAATVALARRARKTIVLSYHDFDCTPSTSRLERLLATAKNGGADIFKIAATPETTADVVRLLEFTLQHRRDNIVVIAMGSLGAISRLAFPLAGSLLTYTNVKPSLGQIPLRELAADLKRFYPKQSI